MIASTTNVFESPHPPRKRAWLAAATLALAVFAALPATAARRPGAPAYTPPQEGNDHVLALVEQYREQVARYANGDVEAAFAATELFEARTLAGDRKHGVELLDRAEEFLYDEFILHGRALLLPLAAFHRDLMLRHFAAHRWALAQRAQFQAEHLLAAFGGKARGVERRRLGASAFMAFAADMIEGVPNAHQPQELLLRSLLLAPDHVGANIVLGVLLQQDARLPIAALRFDRALGFAPDDREARLRRAVLRATLESFERAEPELQALAETPADDWIAVVAAQEIVRDRLASDRYDDAAALSTAALERFPDEPSFAVTRAFAERRRGNRAEAGAALDAALIPRASTETSARRRYEQVPLGRLAADREAFAQEAAVQRPRLAEAIAYAPGTEPRS